MYTDEFIFEARFHITFVSHTIVVPPDRKPEVVFLPSSESHFTDTFVALELVEHEFYMCVVVVESVRFRVCVQHGLDIQVSVQDVA